MFEQRCVKAEADRGAVEAAVVRKGGQDAPQDAAQATFFAVVGSDGACNQCQPAIPLHAASTQGFGR